MNGPVWDALTAASRVAFVHAHPDDETLTTGALMSALADAGVECCLVTATRGERGEVVDGVVTGDRPLSQIRAVELADAMDALGVARHAMLGQSPARADDAAPVRYTDSGMRWLDGDETLAGPALDARADSLTAMPVGEEVADLTAALERWRVDLVVSYDEAGTYGHPDHVRVHEIASLAASRIGVRFLEVISPGREVAVTHERVELASQMSALGRALASYATQLTVLGETTDPASRFATPGFRVRHVGGQAADVWCEATLRWGDQ